MQIVWVLLEISLVVYKPEDRIDKKYFVYIFRYTFRISALRCSEISGFFWHFS